MPNNNKLGMFSVTGGSQVRSIIEGAIKYKGNKPDEELYAYLRKRMNTLAKTHDEVWDTAVREVIIGRIERATNRQLSIYF